MKDLEKFRSKILTKRKIQLEINNLRRAYHNNPSPVLVDKIISKTKELNGLK